MRGVADVNVKQRSSLTGLEDGSEGDGGVLMMQLPSLPLSLFGVSVARVWTEADLGWVWSCTVVHIGPCSPAVEREVVLSAAWLARYWSISHYSVSSGFPL